MKSNTKRQTSITSKRDRPSGAPSNALYVSKSLVNGIARKIMNTVQRSEDLRDSLDLRSIGRHDNPLNAARRKIYFTIKDASGTSHKMHLSVYADWLAHSFTADVNFRKSILQVNIPAAKQHMSEKYFSSELVRVLTHEIAHVRDPAVWSSDKGTRGMEWGAYLNDPREVKARIAEVIHQLSARKATSAIHVPTDPDMAMFKTSPLPWAETYSSTWGRIKDELTPVNKRKFMIAISEAYNRAFTKRAREMGVKGVNLPFNKWASNMREFYDLNADVSDVLGSLSATVELLARSYDPENIPKDFRVMFLLQEQGSLIEK